jgi:hypothetical protein
LKTSFGWPRKRGMLNEFCGQNTNHLNTWYNSSLIYGRFLGMVCYSGHLSVTIAGTIIGIGLIIWQELRRQETKYLQTTQELNNLNGFPRSITRSQIQEKIAVLHDYPTQIPDWKNEDTLRYKTNRIISDVRAIQEVRPLLRDRQDVLEELHVIRTEIIAAMSGKQESLNRINAAFDVLFSGASP